MNAVYREYAAAGAAIRYHELQVERDHLLELFPELHVEDLRIAGIGDSVSEQKPKRTRRPLTEAERKALSRAMKRSWRERRAAEHAFRQGE